jgi:hypothetical protein
MNTDDSTAKTRVSIRAYHTQACWTEDDEETEQELLAKLYDIDNTSLHAPSMEAERLEAPLDADPFLRSEQVFKTVSGSNFSPLMTTSFDTVPPVAPIDAPNTRPTAQWKSAAETQRDGEVSSWTSHAAAGAGASPSANGQFHRWCAIVGLGGRSNGLHAETLRRLHLIGCDADALKLMVPVALVERGIDRSQAILVYNLMRAKSGDRDAPPALQSLRQQLAELGADKKTVKFLEILGKDLDSLKTMNVNDVRFSHLTAAQKEKIAPLLAVDPLLDRTREEHRAQEARRSTRISGRRNVEDEHRAGSLPPDRHTPSAEHQRDRSARARNDHKVKGLTSRVRIIPGTESKRDTSSPPLTARDAAAQGGQDVLRTRSSVQTTSSQITLSLRRRGARGGRAQRSSKMTTLVAQLILLSWSHGLNLTT